MNPAGMTLEQHFCNACGSSEIAVYLERRMRIEHIRVCAASFIIRFTCIRYPQLSAEHLVGMVTVLETCLEIDFPAHRPAGSAVAAHFK